MTTKGDTEVRKNTLRTIFCAIPLLFLASCSHYEYPEVFKIDDKPTYGYVLSGDKENPNMRLSITGRQDLDPKWSSCRVKWRILRRPFIFDLLTFKFPCYPLSSSINKEFHSNLSWMPVNSNWSAEYAACDGDIFCIMEFFSKENPHHLTKKKFLCVYSSGEWEIHENFPLELEPCEIFRDANGSIHLVTKKYVTGSGVSVADYSLTDMGEVSHRQSLFEAAFSMDAYQSRNTKNELVYAVKRNKTPGLTDFELWGFDGTQWVPKRTIPYKGSIGYTDKINESDWVFWSISPEGNRIAVLRIEDKTAIITIVGEKETRSIQYPLDKDIMSRSYRVSLDWESEESFVIETFTHGRSIHHPMAVYHYRLTPSGVKKVKENPYDKLEIGSFHSIITISEMLGLR